MELKVGYKNTELGIIPDEWDEVQLKDYIKINSGESPSRFLFIDKGVPYFKVEQLNNSSKFQINTPYYISYNKSVNKGSIIFPKRGAAILLNKIRILNQNSFMDTNLMTLTVYNPSLFNEYLFYYLTYKGLSHVADTTSVPQINNKHINPFKIPLPPLPEQTAIATVLSDTDSLIQALEKKIAKKQLIKKGAMQKLLTLKEGWENSLLEDVCDRIGVGLATSVTKYYRNSGTPIIRNLNIKDGYFDGTKMLFLDKDFANANMSKAAKANDVLTVHTGSNIGLTCVLPEEFNNCQTFTTLITTPKKSVLTPYYLSLHMSSSKGKIEIDRLQVGGGKGNLNTGDLKNYNIAFPKSIEEQNHITNILSDMDSEIKVLEKKLAKYKELKQGLMQNLLTGKIRLLSGVKRRLV